MAEYASYIVLLIIAIGLGGPALWLFFHEPGYGSYRDKNN